MKEVLSKETTDFIDNKVTTAKKFDFTQNEKQEAEDLKNLLIYQIKRLTISISSNYFQLNHLREFV